VLFLTGRGLVADTDESHRRGLRPRVVLLGQNGKDKMDMVTIGESKLTPPEAAFSAINAYRPDRRLTPSPFPRDAVARIFRAGRSAMTSGKARGKHWRLIFERRSAPYVEPLMGWTGDDDPLATVELSFSTLRAAVDYAERQGLPYVVQAGGTAIASQLQAIPRKNDARLLRRDPRTWFPSGEL
jgi:hypothetical protein